MSNYTQNLKRRLIRHIDIVELFETRPPSEISYLGDIDDPMQPYEPGEIAAEEQSPNITPTPAAKPTGFVPASSLVSAKDLALARPSSWENPGPGPQALKALKFKRNATATANPQTPNVQPQTTKKRRIEETTQSSPIKGPSAAHDESRAPQQNAAAPSSSTRPSGQDPQPQQTPLSLQDLLGSSREMGVIKMREEHTPGSMSHQPAIAITPTPPNGGFPEVHMENATFLLFNVPDQIKERWINEPTCKVLIQLWGSGTGHQGLKGRGPQVVRILERLHHTTGLSYWMPTNPDISKRTSPPWSLLVYKIPPEVKAAIEAQRVYSTPELTFFAYPFKYSNPRYIMSLTGFSTNDADDICEAVVERLCQNDVYGLVEEFCERNPTLKNIGMDAIHDLMIQSMQLIPIVHHGDGGIPYHVWELHLTPPSNDWEEADRFRDSIRRIQFIDTKVGSARHYNISPCTGCHSVNHPRGLCPFTNIPGWYGPTAEQMKNADHTGRVPGGHRDNRDNRDNQYFNRGGAGRGFRRGGGGGRYRGRGRGRGGQFYEDYY